MYPVKNSQASVVLRVKLLDSSSTVGAGLTGLTSASAGLIIGTIADNEATTTAYTVTGATIETITTLGTYAAPTATKCRFKEVDATNHKGVYELQFADARFAVASAKSLLISILGATNLAQVDVVVPLVSDDPYVAKPTNSALLSIDASGRIDVIKVAGTTQTAGNLVAEHDATQAAMVIIDDFIDTEVAAILAAVDTEVSDIQARIPAALTAGGNIKADSLGISGSTVAADNLEASALGIVVSSVNDAAATSTVFITALTEATNDHYKGRVIVFTSGAMAGQATDITAYNGTTKAVTVTAMTEAPANGTTFVVV